MVRSPHELEYSPSSLVDDFEGLIEQYRAKSETARAELSHLTLAYGQGGDELVDVFPALDGGRLHVFFHGGYWQQLSRRHASFHASKFSDQGIAYAAPGYTLAPNLDLAGIVDQARRAVEFLAKILRAANTEPLSIIVSGSSAGAHLAAMVALADWSETDLAESPVAGLALLSGIYDIRPLVDTYVNDSLGMDEQEAWSLSPLNLVEQAATNVPMLVAVGEIETDAFKNQATLFAEAAGANGHEATCVEIAGRNHFDIVFDLASRDTELGRRLTELEGSVGWR